MNRAVLLSFMIAAAVQTPAGDVSISGVVVDSVSGNPVPGVVVRIAALRQNSTPPGTSSQIVTIRPMLQQATDANGRFLLDNFEPGTHNVFVVKDGYESTNRSYTIEPGERIQDTVFRIVKLPAPAVVTGRVVDSTGQPVPKAPVELLQYSYQSHFSLGASSDHPELLGVAGGPNGGLTDDRGIFRIINIPPGEYFLRIPPPGTAGDSLSPLGALFFPGVAGISRAEKLKVESGSEMQLGTFTLAPSMLQPVRVLVTNSTGERTISNSPRIYVFAGGSVPDFPPVQTGLLNDVPAFRPDEPGQYTVCDSVVVNDAEVPNVAFTRHACTSIDYTGAVMDVALTVTQPQGRLTGRVLLEHAGTPPTPLAGVSIAALGLGPGTNFGATSGPDGTLGSSYRVHEEPAVLKSIQVPEGYYVVSARQGERDVLTRGLLVEAGGTGLEVLVSAEGGTMQGHVTNAQGEPVEGATVVLSPNGDLTNWTNKQNTTPTTKSDERGGYEIKGIIPGEYRAYAFLKIENGAYWDRNYMGSFAERGTPVQFEKSGRKSLDLKLADESSKGGR